MRQAFVCRTTAARAPKHFALVNESWNLNKSRSLSSVGDAGQCAYRAGNRVPDK